MSAIIEEAKQANLGITKSTSPPTHLAQDLNWKVGTSDVAADIDEIVSGATAQENQVAKCSIKQKRALRSLKQRSSPDAGWSQRIADDLTNATD